MGVIVVGEHGTTTLISMFLSVVFRAYGVDTRIIGEFVTTLEEAEASIALEHTKTSLV